MSEQYVGQIESGTIQSMIKDTATIGRLLRERPDLFMQTMWPQPTPNLFRENRQMIVALGQLLEDDMCDKVFWTSELHGAAIAGSENFVGATVTADMWPDFATYWYFEKDLNIELPEIPWWKDGWTIHSAILLHAENTLNTFVLVSCIFSTTEPMRLLCAGKTFLGDILHNNHEAAHCAMQSFLRLPFVGLERQQASRPERRRAQKEGRTLPTVQMIVLRHLERRESDGESKVDREYSCHWLRRGHWRQLPEPRKSDGAQMTYVRQALCGPEDKPFRAPRPRIYIASR